MERWMDGLFGDGPTPWCGGWDWVTVRLLRDLTTRYYWAVHLPDPPEDRLPPLGRRLVMECPRCAISPEVVPCPPLVQARCPTCGVAGPYARTPADALDGWEEAFAGHECVAQGEAAQHQADYDAALREQGKR